MMLRAQAVAAARRRLRLRRWAVGHRGLVIAVVSLLIGLPLAVYGSGGNLKFFGFAVPETWAAVVLLMAVTAGKWLSPALVRWLAWSTWPALIIQQLAYVADHQRADPFVLTALLGAWVLVVVSFAARSHLIGHYRPFAYQYLWLLVLAIAFVVLIFVVPLASVHAMMSRQKEAVLLPEADRLLSHAQALQARLLTAGPAEQYALERQLAALTKRYQELEATPTWPVDASIRRRFAARNVALVIPFAGFLISNWQPIPHIVHAA